MQPDMQENILSSVDFVMFADFQLLKICNLLQYISF